MSYDLLVKNGRIVDGSGMPSFNGDLGVRNGKIVEMGKLSGPASRVIDADGLVVSPGFVDNHCHYDAQVTWDPLCSFSGHHGATTVIIGNCSLSLSPVRPGTQERLAEFLSYVEAIPMEVLRTVDFTWETVGQYMDSLEGRLGLNLGTLIGHSSVRHYVMGDESQGRAATEKETEAMRGIVREAMEAGALGLSVSQNRGHFDPQGVLIPAIWATEEEIFALGDVLGELGTGVIQSGGGRETEIKNRLMSRLSQRTGRLVTYTDLSQAARRPEEWMELMAIVDETSREGIRSYPMCSPNSNAQRFNMKNCQIFRGLPTWHPLLLASDDEKMKAYSDPEIREKLHEEAVEWRVEVGQVNIPHRWYDFVWVDEPQLEKNRHLKGKRIGDLAEEQGKRIIDSFLDLVVEEKLETLFVQRITNMDVEAMERILNYPNTVVGLSDGGAHVQFNAGYGYSTRLLGRWVREQGIMSLENAVKRLTFESASAFGIFDRGLLRPGMAADITVFDPETVTPLPDDVVHDFPAGGWRVRELAEGIKYTIVNGEPLLEEGVHSGALPGRVMRNTLYNSNGK